MPWRKDELVRVAPYNEQIPDSKYYDNFVYCKKRISEERFRNNYVKVIRKSENGWDKVYIEEWKNFKPLNTKTK